MPKTNKKAAVALVGLMGLLGAGFAINDVSKWEGFRSVGYLDIVNVPTKCFGDTTGVTVGKKYTFAECEESISEEVLKHATGVINCTPGLRENPYQFAAATSLAYNIGIRGYCRSTVARRFNAGDWRGACNAFLMWNRAGGRVVQGLVNRRRDERRRCLSVPPQYSTAISAS
ncbi:MAG: lysozyme [Parasphingorhabdus sp.]|uniref:lysozyme n=1 Tax=Parasphingorhabdus sp. TaxID=2709688 RepID=UPI003297DF6D